MGHCQFHSDVHPFATWLVTPDYAKPVTRALLPCPAGVASGEGFFVLRQMWREQPPGTLTEQISSTAGSSAAYSHQTCLPLPSVPLPQSDGSSLGLSTLVFLADRFSGCGVCASSGHCHRHCHRSQDPAPSLCVWWGSAAHCWGEDFLWFPPVDTRECSHETVSLEFFVCPHPLRAVLTL